MQKSLYLIIFLVSNFITISAQDLAIESTLDSITEYKKLSVEAYGRGDFLAFKKYCDTLLIIANKNNLHEVRVNALINLGIYYNNINQYEESLSKYLEASEISNSLPENTRSKILILVNMGNVYNSIGNYNKATSSMNKVIELADSQENAERYLIAAYNALGTIAVHKKDYENSLKYMYQVKDLAIKMNRVDLIITALNNISDIHLRLNQYKEAIDKSTEALQLYTPEGSVESKAWSKLNIGAAFIGLEKPLHALPLLKEAKKIAISGNLLKIKMFSHQYLANVYESIDSIKNSLEEQKLYTETREVYLKSLSKAQKLEVEKELKTKSNIINEQQNSILFLNKEKQLYVFLGISLAILLITSSIIYWMRRKKLAKESLLLKGDKELLQNENELLKDKLNALAKSIQEEKTELQQHKKSSLDKKEQEVYMNRILNYMEEKKPYLDHEIKQSDIAKSLDISVHLFSEILNVCFHKNFNNFMNLYRIDRAKQLIKDPNFKHYKILAIGYEAGFPSKTSFNRVFKNLVGLTPTEYQKEYLATINLEEK